MNLHENFTMDVSVEKEEPVKFWKSSTSGSGRIQKFFEGFFNIAK